MRLRRVLISFVSRAIARWKQRERDDKANRREPRYANYLAMKTIKECHNYFAAAGSCFSTNAIVAWSVFTVESTLA